MVVEVPERCGRSVDGGSRGSSRGTENLLKSNNNIIIGIKLNGMEPNIELI
jgi:hypothetical protein